MSCLFRPCATLLLVVALYSVAASPAAETDGNRLTYLDGSDPYYVSAGFPKLVTQQWVGDEGVRAVVTLGIDDMREIAKYENYLRPIIDRLAQLEGDHGLSIMTNRIDPAEPHLKKWLAEGVSIEIHTYDHPCPLLKDGDFAKAKGTYDRCVDLISKIDGYRPLAYRMPCCDSLNTVSPRFFTEIFNGTTPGGNYLEMDTSVFHVFDQHDPDLPRELLVDPDGAKTFEKYVPYDRSFVNTIFNYPYPYPIARLCWEFPCVTPSDWSAQHRHKPFNPQTVTDWQKALDATVVKQGTFNLVFHPHGWIRNGQIVQLIDHAQQKHGRKVAFLSFQQAYQRLKDNLLAGQPLRDAAGRDNGVRLIDLNHDGYLDVVIGNQHMQKTRIWQPQQQTWRETSFPTILIDDEARQRHAGCRFGVIDGKVCLLELNDSRRAAWVFAGDGWSEKNELVRGLTLDNKPVLALANRSDCGVRLRDVDHDGTCELLIASPAARAVFRWSSEKQSWQRLTWTLPPNAEFVDNGGGDGGLRFVDLDDDGFDDLVYSNDQRWGVAVFVSLEAGYKLVSSGDRQDPDAIPMIARGGTNNGAWFHSGHLWVQNEDTAKLPGLVDRRTFADLLEDDLLPPKSPRAGLNSIKVDKRLRVELVASEPLVADPVAFDWAADGSLWVVEMADYPLGIDGKGKAGGRVRYLQDTDGDGRYDKSSLFLEGLAYPTGVMSWRDGILVTAAGAIHYAEDTDGDLRADVFKPLFVGFGEGNPQHRLNGLRYGLDHWIYCGNADARGGVKSVATGEQVAVGKRDVRLRPDDGRIDPQSGETQFGRVRDDWGNWFGCSNSQPAYHYALTDHYLRRNPHLPVPSTKVQISVAPGAAPVFPASRTLARFNDHNKANRFTSACGLEIYRDTLLGEDYSGNTFVCEPVHNLVHREIVSANGSTFRSQRPEAEQQSEFLASSDNWFRPTMARTGPDGALWISDMYRLVIEHPEWIPADWQQRLDLRAGADKGRIYRIVPADVKERQLPRLDCMSTTELVAQLASRNGWLRDKAQMMLIWRADRAAVAPLEELLKNGATPTARLHALCTLAELNSLSAEQRLHALNDEYPGVRRHAVRLSEPLLATDSKLAARVLELADDADIQVQMQVAYSLGAWPDKQVGPALAKLARSEDRYVRTAALSSAPVALEQVIAGVLAPANETSPPVDVIESLVTMAVASDNRAAVVRICRALSATTADGAFAPWQWSVVDSLLSALARRDSSLDAFLRDAGDDAQAAAGGIERLFAAAGKQAGDDKLPLSQRQAAIALLGRKAGDSKQASASLEKLLSPQQPLEIQLAAVRALASGSDEAAAERLLAHWGAFGPRVRAEVLEALTRRTAWVAALLAAIEASKLSAADVDAAARQQLLNHRDEKLRKLAEKLFAAGAGSRAEVVKQYQHVLTMTGNATAGEQLFAKKCSVCHRLNDKGHDIGPDLAALTDKSPPAMLLALLDPNKAVERKYVNYVAITTDGRTFQGILASESGASITLLQQEGKKETILRADLEELYSSGKSLMPEGLEKDVKPQDLADVIAYVSGTRAPRREFAGNQPQVIEPEALRGEFYLLARHSEIYGKTLVFEQQFGNLGYWQSPGDHAKWTVDIKQPGTYDVAVEYACPPSHAGDVLVIEVAGQRLRHTVESTGSWEAYDTHRVGTVQLTPGQQRLAASPGSPINKALLDLKTIRLRPVK